MAIKLIANYSKRLGLPGYSSHQFSVEVEAELSSVDGVQDEVARIYALVQENVDEQIRITGFIPDSRYGTTPQTGKRKRLAASGRRAVAWKCTERQRELIESLVAEHGLDKRDVEALAMERFGKGVRALKSVEASGLIEALMGAHGQSRRGAYSSQSQRRAA